MRTIPAATQAVLNTDLGAEIIIVLEVNWGTGTPSAFYADRSIEGTPVKGKILDLSEFEESVQVSGGGQSQQFSVTLDDTDGEIKAIFDTNDVHKAPVRAWFYVAGTNFATEKFSVFLGQINSPVVWSEGLRQFSFSIVNRIEDVEVGFSAEEGAFPHLPEELIGKPWPLCFGTTINVPALKAVPAVSGALARGIGIADFTLPHRIALADLITCPRTPVGFKCHASSAGISYNAICNIAYEDDQSCLQSRCVELERLRLQLQEQQSYEFPTMTIFGGKEFPQGRRIVLNINGGLFTGFFNGTPTNPSNVFHIQSRKHPRDSGNNTLIKEDLETEIASLCPSSEDAQDSDFEETAFGPVFTGLRSSRISWENYRNADAADFFWAGGGSTVTMQNNNSIIYIANIIPSTILRVAAWRTLNGNQFLLTVPSRFFTIRQVDYVGYDVMEIVFQRPLSTEQQDTGGGWSDDVFITQTASVGPNTVDILEWIIETYTGYSTDAASFADVKTKLTKYPMHFPLLERHNLLQLLQDLAQKARCALWQKDNTFYIKYLAETPTPVATITEDDVLQNDSSNGTLEIELTKTEELRTQLTSKWRKDYSLEKDNTLILRHNVDKYGTHKHEENYYPYAHLQLVRKSSTFWLIRWANTWKRIKFSTSLEFMKLEAFDAITIDLPDVASTTFLGIVDRVTLDSNGKQLNFEVWTPIRAGESTAYNFAFPAAISENALYPTIEARNANQAGSGKEPNFSTVAPPGHPLRTNTSGIFQGISLGCNGDPVTSLAPGECRQDFGDRKPSDIGDVAPTVDVAADATGNVSDSTSPVANGSGYGYWSTYQGLKDRDDKIEGDSSRGRENAQRGGQLTDDETTLGGDDFEDYLRNLPDPDDLDPDTYPCQVQVRIIGFKTEEQGTQPICSPASGSFNEVLVFNSATAAAEMCESLEGNSNCGANPPCGNCLNCSVVRVVGPEGCEPPEGEEPSIIGYSNTNSTESFLN